MSNGITEYHIEIDGNKVTMVLVTDSPEAADKLAQTLTARFQTGVVGEIDVMEKPDE